MTRTPSERFCADLDGVVITRRQGLPVSDAEKAAPRAPTSTDRAGEPPERPKVAEAK
ncbi:MAG: hypothetical protein QM651_13695 [Rhodoblastus sp.]